MIEIEQGQDSGIWENASAFQNLIKETNPYGKETTDEKLKSIYIN